VTKGDEHVNRNEAVQICRHTLSGCGNFVNKEIGDFSLLVVNALIFLKQVQTVESE